MYLKHLTWQETESYLAQKQSIIIPIGSHEQHGPNGMLGTDIICPVRVAEEVSAQTGVLIGPAIEVGMAQHHLGFAGSMTVRPTTLIAIIEDYAKSLARHGFTHFLFLNGHGGNNATVQAAFAQIHAEVSLARAPADQPELELVLCNWYMGPRVNELSRRHFPGTEGSHATPSEVSLTFYAYPEHAKSCAPLEPRVAPSGPFGSAADYRRRFPDGRIGSDPTLATVEIGKAMCEAATADVIATMKQRGFVVN
jgi:creatinine amidohydrolase